MTMVFEFLATLSAALFSGAAIYVSLVEHPARLECGTAVALAQFAPSYKRGAVMQVLLAVLGFVSGALAWFTGASIPWLFGGLLLGSVIPFTLIVIFPTNRNLLDPTLDRNSPQALALLGRWGRLHAVRSFVSLASCLVFLFLFVTGARN